MNYLETSKLESRVGMIYTLGVELHKPSVFEPLFSSTLSDFFNYPLHIIEIMPEPSKK